MWSHGTIYWGIYASLDLNELFLDKYTCMQEILLVPQSTQKGPDVVKPRHRVGASLCSALAPWRRTRVSRSPLKGSFRESSWSAKSPCASLFLQKIDSDWKTIWAFNFNVYHKLYNFTKVGIYQWLNVRLQYFRCIRNGDTIVLHWAIDLSRKFISTQWNKLHGNYCMKIISIRQRKIRHGSQGLGLRALDPENPMRPLWKFTRGPNGPHICGEFAMYSYGGTLHDVSCWLKALCKFTWWRPWTFDP